jgi:cobalt-zinc-cadmium efflux system membrane fusion protein
MLPLRAPFAGIVVERSAVIGEVVDSRTPLFSIADTSKMWAMLDIYESDIPRARDGQSVVFQADGLPGEQFAGRVTWISSHVERRTRTLKVRAEIANADGLLRSGMFGKASISVRKDESALVVPKEAVQWEGCCNVVFVKSSDVLFEPRKVKLGYETERAFVVEYGLDAGEEIVTVGSFLLKTEILKGNIGAGCCEVKPGKE